MHNYQGNKEYRKHAIGENGQPKFVFLRQGPYDGAPISYPPEQWYDKYHAIAQPMTEQSRADDYGGEEHGSRLVDSKGNWLIPKRFAIYLWQHGAEEYEFVDVVETSNMAEVQQVLDMVCSVANQ